MVSGCPDASTVLVKTTRGRKSLSAEGNKTGLVASYFRIQYKHKVCKMSKRLFDKLFNVSGSSITHLYELHLDIAHDSHKAKKTNRKDTAIK